MVSAWKGYVCRSDPLDLWGFPEIRGPWFRVSFVGFRAGGLGWGNCNFGVYGGDRGDRGLA